VGAAAMALVFAGAGKDAAKRLGLLAVGAVAVGGVALVFGVGRSLFELLPFVGTVGSETVEYRKRLFEVSMRILSQSPVFGSPRFYGDAAAQELRGEGGLIDMVNSYLGVAMGSGVAGLALFVGLFAFAALLAWRTCRFSEQEPRAADVGRALLAAIAGILVTIGTTSSVSVIQPIYFMIVGLTVGWCGQFLALGRADEGADRDPADDAAARPFGRPLGVDAG